jgi:hypothetical protein
MHSVDAVAGRVTHLRGALRAAAVLASVDCNIMIFAIFVLINVCVFLLQARLDQG